MTERTRQLIRGMQEQDPTAFDEFARAWYPRIVNWVSTRTSPDKVEDYAQSVWLHLTEDGCRRLLRWGGLYADTAGNPHSFDGYLKRITQRKVIDLHRIDNKQWLDYGDPPEVIDRDGRLGVDPLDEVEGEQIKRVFRACFGQLQIRDKKMLIMKWSGRSDDAIGRRFQMLANNVRQRCHQMVRKLRACLSAKLPAYFNND